MAGEKTYEEIKAQVKTYEEIKAQVKIFLVESPKFYEGNKSAGMRARKALDKIAKLIWGKG